MRWHWFVVALVLAWATGGIHSSEVAAQQARMARDGSLTMAGRQVRCENVRTELDPTLPNLGAAAPDERLLLLNPGLLARYSPVVQLFVFHHECGHHRVGESELKADCWAAETGVRDGWLDRNGLANICRSFENAPESATHPSGQHRCANLDRCFASAESEAAKRRAVEIAHKARAAPKASAAGPSPDRPARPIKTASAADAVPRLLAGPRLVRSSVVLRE